VLLTFTPVYTPVNSHGLCSPFPIKEYCRGGAGWGPRDLRNFCRGLKPELVESQGPRERSRYPRVQPLLKGVEEQLEVRGQGANPGGCALPSSL
jgi:hypothetical protein